MNQQQSKTDFIDLKFFLGLMFMTYGAILVVTGTYFLLNPLSSISSSIDIYWGLLMVATGSISYHKSSKPSSWNKAFSHPGIEHIEERLKVGLRNRMEKPK